MYSLVIKHLQLPMRITFRWLFNADRDTKPSNFSLVLFVTGSSHLMQQMRGIDRGK